MATSPALGMPTEASEMIRGYAAQPSLLPGNRLGLHVSTTSPQFRVRFYRQGANLEYIAQSEWLRGIQAAEPATAAERTRDWNWPEYWFPIPSEWPSGVYIALLIEDVKGRLLDPPESAPAIDGRHGRVLFVVKNSAPGKPASILYNLPLFTYQAYNYTGRSNFYMRGNPPGPDQTHRVSLRRPGAGVGGDIGGEYDGYCGSACDWYDASSPRNTFAHWDAPFIGWLLASGYQLDFCTDLDLHDGTSALSSYRLLLCAGHHEYWSTEMRDRVESFVHAGGNVALFSGNTCWWRVRVRLDGAQLECRKIDNGDLWWSGAHRVENSVTGVSYRNGGAWWDGAEREALGFTVQHSSSWVYEGTGMRDGETFGREQALVGFECDGAAVSEPPSTAHPLVPSFQDGTPATFQILGWAQLSKFGNGMTGWWQESNEATNPGLRVATMGVFTDGGTVFNGATTDWVRVVVKAREPRTIRITHNVLKHLSGQEAVGPAESASHAIADVFLRPVTIAGGLLAALRTPMTRRLFLSSGLMMLLACSKWGRRSRFP